MNHDLSVYLNNIKPIASTKLRTKLIRAGLKSDQCEECHLIEWRDKPLRTELHHINGDHADNTLANLLILCPNCHSQAESHVGHVRKKYDFTDEALLTALSKSHSIKEALMSLSCPSNNVAYWSRAYQLMASHPECRLMTKLIEPKPLPREVTEWPSIQYLANRVWEVKQSTLAREIGCTASALRAHLSRCQVKCPPIGYWHRRSKGESHEQALVPYSGRPKRHQRKLLDDQVREAFSRVSNGDGLRRVAKTLGVWHTTLIARFKTLGLSKPNGVTDGTCTR